MGQSIPVQSEKEFMGITEAFATSHDPLNSQHTRSVLIICLDGSTKGSAAFGGRVSADELERCRQLIDELEKRLPEDDQGCVHVYS